MKVKVLTIEPKKYTQDRLTKPLCTEVHSGLVTAYNVIISHFGLNFRIYAKN